MYARICTSAFQCAGPGLDWKHARRVIANDRSGLVAEVLQAIACMVCQT